MIRVVTAGLQVMSILLTRVSRVLCLTYPLINPDNLTPFVTSNDPWGVILRVSELASLMNIYIHSYDNLISAICLGNKTLGVVHEYCSRDIHFYDDLTI